MINIWILAVESIDIINILLSDPKVALTVIIQIALGLALGYFSVKIIKYILALIGIIVLGSVMSIWSIGGGIEGFLARLGGTAIQLKPVIMNLLTTLGVLTVGPVTIGFILGLIIGFLRR